jgi:hypothetical protein
MSETPSNALHVVLRVIPIFMATSSLSRGHNLCTCGGRARPGGAANFSSLVSREGIDTGHVVREPT